LLGGVLSHWVLNLRRGSLGMEWFDKFLGKLDFRTDWESKLDDPKPLSVKSLFLALISFPLAVILLTLLITILFFVFLFFSWLPSLVGF